MRRLISIFFYGFLLHAAISLADLWLPLEILHYPLTLFLLLLGLALYLLAAFLPAVPKLLILPAVLFLVWGSICGGFPLAFIYPGHAELIVCVFQLFWGTALYPAYRRWVHQPPAIEPPRFSWLGFASIILLTLVATPLVLGSAAVQSLGTMLEERSGGYVKLRPEGLMLEERNLAKDGKNVRLVSMMHIGQKGFYDGVLASLPPEDHAVVLMEGVTDEKALLQQHFSYAKIARLLGLTSQESSSFQHEGKAALTNPTEQKKSLVEYRHADVDISSFQPLTLEFIGAIGAILSNPTMDNFVKVVQAPDSPFQKPGAEESVMLDLIDKRNEHLVGEIDQALTTSPMVVVPWGALHLPDIEATLKERGFQETNRITRPIIRFWPSPTPALPK